jgi:putative membrane protein
VTQPAGVEDATRRTRLANERTYLAWLRSALTAYAVSLAAGKLIPELTGAERWPWALLGVGFALLGTVFAVYGLVRKRAVDAALTGGGYAEAEDSILLALTTAGALLGIASLVLVVATT